MRTRGPARAREEATPAPARHETAGAAAPPTESVYYNCVCDEVVSLRCGNGECREELPPDAMLTITPDGSVYCSDRCAAMVAG